MGAGPKVRCLLCDDVIQSQHRHDFVRCECRSLYVDGGDAYLRMGAADLSQYEIVEEDTKD